MSISRLTAEQRSRYVELAVFGKDVAIPSPVLERYWRAIGSWSAFQTRRYCQRLAELALSVTTSRIPTEWCCMTSSASTCVSRPGTGAVN